MLLFGMGLTGLVTSLGGLFAVDIAPKRAAGAAMGVVGIFSYIGAAVQEQVSGILIDQQHGRQRRRPRPMTSVRSSGSGSGRRCCRCCWPQACGAPACATERSTG